MFTPHMLRLFYIDSFRMRYDTKPLRIRTGERMLASWVLSLRRIPGTCCRDDYL